jgi:rhomboid protease GluP
VNPFRQIISDTASLLRDVRRGWKHLKKMCRECRALIAAGASECPECGASTAHIRSGGLHRALSRTLPFEMSVSSVLISVYFLLFIIGVLLTATLEPRPGEDVPTLMQAIMSIDGRALVMTGANWGPLSGGPEPWRLLTAIFLHAGLLHLAFNTMAIRIIGPLMEHLYGPRRMFVLYLGTGIASNIVSLWWHGPRLLQVGASGALFGLIGVAAAYGFRRRDAMGEMLRRNMMTWAMYGIMMGIFFRADNAAHIGGLLAGAALAFLIPDPQKRQHKTAGRIWSVLAVAGVIACIGAFAITAIRYVVGS